MKIILIKKCIDCPLCELVYWRGRKKWVLKCESSATMYGQRKRVIGTKRSVLSLIELDIPEWCKLSDAEDYGIEG